jgi:hypothetical protein
VTSQPALRAYARRRSRSTAAAAILFTASKSEAFARPRLDVVPNQPGGIVMRSHLSKSRLWLLSSVLIVGGVVFAESASGQGQPRTERCLRYRQPLAESRPVPVRTQTREMLLPDCRLLSSR